MRRAWMAVVLAGCFSPSPQPGAPCSAQGTCPSSLTCIDGVCQREGSTTDARLADVPAIDAPADARTDASTPHIQPSNGVDFAPALTLANDTRFENGTITLNTDTGQIAGAYTRAAGTGEIANIIFAPHTVLGVSVGVFWFKDLSVSSSATVRFVGSHAAVFVAANEIEINGVLDASAGCGGDRSCPGPGGGGGANATRPVAGGCGPGGPGTNDGNTGDAGGGGGGAGTAGGSGGEGANAPASTGGIVCLTPTLVPLRGGSGGGHGGLTTGNLTSNAAGGGGGAVQLTANDEITIRGKVIANGAGGEGGVNGGQNGGGNGGGAGGGILIEAAKVRLLGGSLLANGGGGGSGASSSLANPGANGGIDATPALGGAMVAANGAGGNGGAGMVAATSGNMGVNGGGGGGAFGVIAVHAANGDVTLSGTASPAAIVGAIDVD